MHRTWILILFLLTSCGSLIPKKYPQRAKEARFYDFSDTVGVLFHYRCKDNDGKKKCERTEYDIIKEWDFFKYGRFVVIPEGYVF